MEVDKSAVRSGDGHSRARFDATVEFNRAICREHYLMRLRLAPAPGRVFPPTRPGQFVQVGCRPPNGVMEEGAIQGAEFDWPVTGKQADGPGQVELRQPMALLRRPFSLSGRGDDARGTFIEIVYRTVGTGTDWLSQLKPNEMIDLIGPLGNAFVLPPGKSIGLLVGGGVGLPPMFYLAQALRAAGWEAVGFVGAMAADLLAVTPQRGIEPDTNGLPTLCVEEFARHGFPAVVTTNDGSRGLKGLITAGLEHILHRQSRDQADRTVIFTCGPNPMLHAVAKLAATHGVDCQVCLEQAMACGMGTCQSCVVKIDPRKFGQEPQGVTSDGRPWRYKLACTDGPVFDSQLVIW
jgi:dihydroorotate dehydrogenase electron transfer subunit